VLASALVAVALFYLWWPEFHVVRLTCILLLAALVATLATRASGFWHAERDGWLLFASAAITIFFLLAYYETLRGAFGGYMRATHGRYLYPVVPFLLLILLWPARDRRLARAMLGIAAFGMLVAEGFFLRQVFSLYGQLPA
jgi:hypothetical protein